MDYGIGVNEHDNWKHTYRHWSRCFLSALVKQSYDGTTHTAYTGSFIHSIVNADVGWGAMHIFFVIWYVRYSTCAYTLHGRMIPSTNHLLTENYIILLADNIALCVIWTRQSITVDAFQFSSYFRMLYRLPFRFLLSVARIWSFWEREGERANEGFMLWSIDCFM